MHSLVAIYDGGLVIVLVIVMVIVIVSGQHRSILQNWFQLSCKMSTGTGLFGLIMIFGRKYFDHSLYVIL